MDLELVFSRWLAMNIIVNIATTTKHWKKWSEVLRWISVKRSGRSSMSLNLTFCFLTWLQSISSSLLICLWKVAVCPDCDLAHLFVLPMICIWISFCSFFFLLNNLHKRSKPISAKLLWRHWFEMKSNTSQRFDKWFQKTFFGCCATIFSKHLSKKQKRKRNKTFILHF